MTRARLAIWPLLAALCAAPGAAAADDAPTGAILFARDGAIHRVDARGAGEPVEVVSFPEGLAGPVESLQAGSDGRTLLIEAGDTWYWAAPSADGASTDARRLDCRGRARLAPGGDWVLCGSGADVTVLYRLRPRLRKIARLLPPDELQFDPAGGPALVAGRDDGLWAVPLSGRGERRRLSPHRPVDRLLPAPNGRRAVGAYPEGDAGSEQTALYTFPLDGKSVKRRLMAGAPVAWSADSRWLLVQAGRRACIVRAMGGQFKCWKRYRAVALAPGGHHALLARESRPAARGRPARYDLYLARLAGARAGRPRLLLEDVAPAATWLPE